MTSPKARATHYVYVCIGPDCGDLRGSQTLVDSLRAAIDAEALPVELFESACFGQCRSGPNVVVRELAPDEDLLMARLMPLYGKGVTMSHRTTVADVPALVARLRTNPLRR